MLRVKQSKNASYYTNEYGEKENYYDKESKGFWIGAAKEYLGLKDELSIDEYNKLFKGQSPDGKNLTYQTGKNRTYDMSFLCNKGTSILKAAYPEIALSIDDITLTAIKETLQEAQKFIAVRETKNGKTTKNFETNSVFGVFHHSTSRELDPQEHYHCLLMPVSFNSKGKAFANDVKKIFENQKYLGRYFQEKIAKGLEKKHGLKTVFDEKGLSSIDGISREEIEYFSKRKEQIEKLAGPNATYKEKDEASLKSRQVKKEYDLLALQSKWNKELKEKFGFTQERLQEMRNLRPENEKGGKSFNKPPLTEQQKKLPSNQSLFKNIGKLANVKPYQLARASKSLPSTTSANTKEQAIQNISSLQSSLNSLQSQLAATPSNSPTNLQLFAQFIAVGFQLQQAQEQLSQLEVQELQKKTQEQAEINKNDPKFKEKSKNNDRERTKTLSKN